MDELRQEISEITAQMMALFERRLEVSKAIGTYKKRQGLPIHDASREQALIERYRLESYPEQSEAFLQMLFTLSKDVQERETVDE